MSLYNALMGFNPACVVFMPMLGRHQDEYPRFRDCFISDDEKRIVIYTRVGGGNRDCGFGEEELYKDENFVKTYDDDFDSTYGYYEFNVPERWKKDFDAIIANGLNAASDEYVNFVKDFYPNLAKEGIIDKIFRSDAESETEAHNADR